MARDTNQQQVAHQEAKISAHFVRSSALASSRRQHRGSSRRRRSSRGLRQVRFQPIPQPLGEPAPPKTRARLGQLQMRLQVAHKPLARRLQRLGLAKIKLKSFNAILHQKLGAREEVAGPIDGGQPPADHQDDDYGWGSDFDEHSLGSSQGEQPAASSYLLEIGRPSDDRRAIDDVIQDRGCSGQFKRLEAGAELEPPVASQLEQLEQEDDDDDDDGDDDDDDDEELRSLEARQGFRQIRDKLKVILDQRLADFERSASAASGATCEPPARSEAGAREEAAPAKPEPRPNPNPNSAPHEDCQSHCSDDSSLASNHSGSQDSGHSTQHSGYSAHRPLQAPAVVLARPAAKTAAAAAEAPAAELCDERRSRFLQNRLIINSKLESMFQQRAPGAGHGQPVQRSHTMAATTAAATTTETGPTFDQETRSRLLEQQRQMSLKLKQKPRRRSARQTGEAGPHPDHEQGSYASARDSLTKQLSMVCLGGQSLQQQQQQLQLQARPARSLRQLVTEVIDDCERPSKLSTLTMSILNRSDSSSSDLAISADDLTLAAQRQPTPQPPPPPPPSDHQPDPKRLAPASPYQLHHQLRLAAESAANLSASSVASTIDGLEYSPLKEEAAVLGAPEKQEAPKSHTKLGSYLRSLREFSKFKLPKVRLDGVRLGPSTNPVGPTTTTTTTERPPVEPRLVAGLGLGHHLNAHSTLAGAWRRRRPTHAGSPSKASPSQLGSSASALGHGGPGEAFANHYVTISNRKWKSCHLRTSLMQVAFSSPAGATNTGASSPVGASKQHLAYLDNSRNFTDDDNY